MGVGRHTGLLLAAERDGHPLPIELSARPHTDAMSTVLCAPSGGSFSSRSSSSSSVGDRLAPGPDHLTADDAIAGAAAAAATASAVVGPATTVGGVGAWHGLSSLAWAPCIPPRVAVLGVALLAGESAFATVTPLCLSFWDGETGHLRRAISVSDIVPLECAAPPELTALAVDPRSGRRALVGDSEGGIAVVDSASGAVLQRLQNCEESPKILKEGAARTRNTSSAIVAVLWPCPSEAVALTADGRVWVCDATTAVGAPVPSSTLRTFAMPAAELQKGGTTGGRESLQGSLPPIDPWRALPPPATPQVSVTCVAACACLDLLAVSALLPAEDEDSISSAAEPGCTIQSAPPPQEGAAIKRGRRGHAILVYRFSTGALLGAASTAAQHDIPVVAAPHWAASLGAPPVAALTSGGSGRVLLTPASRKLPILAWKGRAASLPTMELAEPQQPPAAALRPLPPASALVFFGPDRPGLLSAHVDGSLRIWAVPPATLPFTCRVLWVLPPVALTPPPLHAPMYRGNPVPDGDLQTAAVASPRGAVTCMAWARGGEAPPMRFGTLAPGGHSDAQGACPKSHASDHVLVSAADQDSREKKPSAQHLGLATGPKEDGLPPDILSRPFPWDSLRHCDAWLSPDDIENEDTGIIIWAGDSLGQIHRWWLPPEALAAAGLGTTGNPGPPVLRAEIEGLRPRRHVSLHGQCLPARVLATALATSAQNARRWAQQHDRILVLRSSRAPVVLGEVASELGDSTRRLGVVWEGSWRGHGGDVTALSCIRDPIAIRAFATAGGNSQELSSSPGSSTECVVTLLLASGGADGVSRLWDSEGRVVGTLDPLPRFAPALKRPGTPPTTSSADSAAALPPPSPDAGLAALLARLPLHPLIYGPGSGSGLPLDRHSMTHVAFARGLPPDISRSPSPADLPSRLPVSASAQPLRLATSCAAVPFPCAPVPPPPFFITSVLDDDDLGQPMQAPLSEGSGADAGAQASPDGSSGACSSSRGTALQPVILGLSDHSPPISLGLHFVAGPPPADYPAAWHVRWAVQERWAARTSAAAAALVLSHIGRIVDSRRWDEWRARRRRGGAPVPALVRSETEPTDGRGHRRAVTAVERALRDLKAIGRRGLPLLFPAPPVTYPPAAAIHAGVRSDGELPARISSESDGSSIDSGDQDAALWDSDDDVGATLRRPLSLRAVGRVALFRAAPLREHAAFSTPARVLFRAATAQESLLRRHPAV